VCVYIYSFDTLEYKKQISGLRITHKTDLN